MAGYDTRTYDHITPVARAERASGNLHGLGYRFPKTKLFTKQFNTSGYPISTKHNYLRPTRGYDSDGIKWNYRDGDCVGYTVHPKLYKGREPKNRDPPPKRPVRHKQRAVARRVKKVSYWVDKPDPLVPIYTLKTAEPQVKDSKAESIPGVTFGYGKVSSLDFRNRVANFVEEPPKPRTGRETFFNWCRYVEIDNHPLKRTGWYDFYKGRMNFVQRSPDIAIFSVEPVIPLQDIEMTMWKYRFKKIEEAFDAFITFPPLTIGEFQVMIYIDAGKFLAEALKYPPALRVPVLRDLAEGFMKQFVRDRRTIPFECCDWDSWNSYPTASGRGRS
jgi:hypothetical protein